ncbi:hypothetical protein BZA70DRAFT_106807 [Myxozyma melibiosi]|uniref:Uncharacterized protein n=1 Tax=Myxozyma melibiosi TaxID=54550 RepID=A0ABR1F9K4_9ASCO
MGLGFTHRRKHSAATSHTDEDQRRTVDHRQTTTSVSDRYFGADQSSQVPPAGHAHSIPPNTMRSSTAPAVDQRAALQQNFVATRGRAGLTQSLRAMKLRSVDMVHPNPKLRFRYEPAERMMVPIDPYEDAKAKIKSKPSEHVDDRANGMNAHALRVAMDREKRKTQAAELKAKLSAAAEASEGSADDPQEGSSRQGGSRQLNLSGPDTDNTDGLKATQPVTTEHQPDNNYTTEDYDMRNGGAREADHPVSQKARIPRYSVGPDVPPATEHQSRGASVFDAHTSDGYMLTSAWTNYLKQATARRIKEEQELRAAEHDDPNFPSKHSRKQSMAYSSVGSIPSEDLYENDESLAYDTESERRMRARDSAYEYASSQSRPMTPEGMDEEEGDIDFDQTPIAGGVRRSRPSSSSVQRSRPPSSSYQRSRPTSVVQKPKLDSIVFGDIAFPVSDQYASTHAHRISVASSGFDDFYTESEDESYIYDSGVAARRARIVRQPRSHHGMEAEVIT